MAVVALKPSELNKVISKSTSFEFITITFGLFEYTNDKIIFLFLI